MVTISGLGSLRRLLSARDYWPRKLAFAQSQRQYPSCPLDGTTPLFRRRADSVSPLRFCERLNSRAEEVLRCKRRDRAGGTPGSWDSAAAERQTAEVDL